MKPGYDRVTEVLGVISEFRWITDKFLEVAVYIDELPWESTISTNSIKEAKDHAMANYQMFLDKGEVGTNVHTAIELFDSDVIVPLSAKEEGYYKSFEEWNKQNKGVKRLHKEQRLYCDDLKITGCIDMMFQSLWSEKLTIFDFKTSATENPITWPLQACFYNYLANKNGFETTDEVFFVKLDKHGKAPKLIQYRCTKQLLNVCFSALSLYRYRNSVVI